MPAASAGALEAELITARAAAADQRERANGELESAIALAGRAGLARRVAILTDQLLGRCVEAETWSSLLRELAADWRDVLHRHRELLRESRRRLGTRRTSAR